MSRQFLPLSQLAAVVAAFAAIVSVGTLQGGAVGFAGDAPSSAGVSLALLAVVVGLGGLLRVAAGHEHTEATEWIDIDLND